MDIRCVLILVNLAFTLVLLTAAEKPPHSYIWQDLLHDYDRRVRPVIHPDTVMTVSMNMHVDNVIDLSWYDEFLQFNASYYGKQFVPGYIYDIWIPDMVLYESVNEENPGMIDQHPVVKLYHTGLVKWTPAVISITACKFDVSNYPFDVQVCPLSFGSWVHPNTDIHLSWNDTLYDNRVFVTSSEWEVKPLTCHVQEDEYGNNNMFDVLSCHLVLARRPLHYIFNLVVPCILLLVIGSFTFLLPVNSGEKVTLSITILLALTVFVLVLMDNLPPNSDGIPFLGKFITACIALLAVSTVMAVSVVNMVARGNEEIGSSSPPRWMRALFLQCLAKLVCFSSKNKTTTTIPEDIQPYRSHNIFVHEADSHHKSSYYNHTPVAKVHEDCEKKQEQSSLHLWVEIATVIDRLYLVIYLSAVVAITATVFVFSRK